MIDRKSEISERVQRELESHTEEDVLGESYKLKNRFSHIWTYPSRKRFFDLIDSHLIGISNKVVLDYGCGRGEASITYLKRGAIVHGIDISPVYIDDATELAKNEGFDDSRFHFCVMDAHKLDYEDNSFDFVVGYGILHHLDPDIALAEIFRVLKPNGRVLLQEPLADNPLLKIFRVMTPNARTEDEAPFTSKDLKRLVTSEKWNAEMVYCGIFEAPVAMLTSVLIPNRPDNALLRSIDKLEAWTHKHDILPGWNQYVLFNLVKS